MIVRLDRMPGPGAFVAQLYVCESIPCGAAFVGLAGVVVGDNDPRPPLALDSCGACGGRVELVGPAWQPFPFRLARAWLSARERRAAAGV